VESQDLYHSAIVGAHDGIMKITRDDPLKAVVQKIAAYSRSRMRKDYPPPKNISTVFEHRSLVVDGDLVQRDLDIQFHMDKLLEFLAVGILSPDEFEMLRLKFDEGLTQKEIAKRFHVAPSTICNRFHKCLDKLRKAFRRSGYDGIS